MQFAGKAIWITWHEHRRTRSLVERLGLPVHVYDDHRPLWRYTAGPLWTARVLIRERPDIVFCHFSFALQLIIMAYKYLVRGGRVTVVSDCHNKALKRELAGPLAGVFHRFKRAIFRGTGLIVVTNDSLVVRARELCPRVAVLRDPLPDWRGDDERLRRARGGDGGHVLFVCSFDKDEPVALIFGAAESIVRDLGRPVVITGNPPADAVPETVRDEPMIRLPGFMPADVYEENLFTAAAVVVLTEDDDCLVCGAYESIGASRPTVLSATSGLENCFGPAATYTAHTVADVVANVEAAIAGRGDSSDQRHGFEAAWREEWTAFRDDLVRVGVLKSVQVADDGS